MGHAGAMTDGLMGTLRSKVEALRASGAEAFDSIEALVDRAAGLSEAPQQRGAGASTEVEGRSR